MISALVLSPSLSAAQPHPRASEAVARSLGALVRAAVEGVLRDVTIIGPSGDDLAALADHAGCAFVETDSTKDGLVRAVTQMRANILLVLEGGYAPPSGFAQEVSDLLLDTNFRGALLRVRARHACHAAGAGTGAAGRRLGLAQRHSVGGAA